LGMACEIGNKIHFDKKKMRSSVSQLIVNHVQP
jgi:hypothetical protein